MLILQHNTAILDNIAQEQNLIAEASLITGKSQSETAQPH